MKWILGLIVAACAGIGGVAEATGSDWSPSYLVAQAQTASDLSAANASALSTAILLSTGDRDMADIPSYSPDQLNDIAACAGIDTDNVEAATDEQLQVLDQCARDTTPVDPANAGLSDEQIDGILACGADYGDQGVETLTDEQLQAVEDCIADVAGGTTTEGDDR